jgi:hypothetical protein
MQSSYLHIGIISIFPFLPFLSSYPFFACPIHLFHHSRHLFQKGQKTAFTRLPLVGTSFQRTTSLI